MSWPQPTTDGTNTWVNGPQVLLSIKEELDAICILVHNGYVKQRGGDTSIVENMAHLWEKIYNCGADGKPNVIVCYNGEQARGGFAAANTLHRVDRQFVVVIMRGHGFQNLLPDGSAKGIEFFTESVEKVRDILRSIQGISCEFPVDYKSCRPLQNVGPGRSGSVFLDAYAIEFSTANDIKQIALEQPPA